MTIISYMEKVKVALAMEEDFINYGVFFSCMEKSFQRIFEAAAGKKTGTRGFHAWLHACLAWALTCSFSNCA